MVANPKQYLRASNGDGPAVRAWISSDREVGDMAIITDTVLNWPNRFVATSGDLNADGTVTETCVFLGHLEGSIIMIDEFAPGYYDEGHQENQVVFIKPASVWADILAQVAEQPNLPAGGATGQALIKASNADGDVEWGDSAPIIGVNHLVPKEVPSGIKNGTNTVFTTAQPYVAGTLIVYRNGLGEGFMVTETDPATGTFTMDAPAATDDLWVSYQYSLATAGNADSLGGHTLGALLDTLFPVGCHWDGGESPDLPPLLASFGTWERFKGRVVVGVDEAETEFNTPGKQGGSKTHLHGLENNGYAKISHVYSTSFAQFASFTAPTPFLGDLKWTATGGNTSANSTSSSRATALGGTTDSSSTLPPYEATYYWKRIA